MLLSELTTRRLGGPARRYVEATAEDELVRAVRAADAAGEPLLVLAGGSNVVIADAGFDGLVVHVATRGVDRRRLGDGRVRLSVAAGE
ncbi:MAG: FAD-binding protein, partial [Solirubrobacteraceae bacterium]